jgi:hypothetical protein
MAALEGMHFGAAYTDSPHFDEDLVGALNSRHLGINHYQTSFGFQESCSHRGLPTCYVSMLLTLALDLVFDFGALTQKNNGLPI